MPRDSEATRRRIIDAAYRCFYREGFYRVSVDAIAAAANVTKKTLYYHFESKDALAGAVLEQQKDHALALIQSALAISERDPAKAIEEIFERLGQWASGRRWHGSGYTRIAMELADLPGHPARVAAKRHKRELEAALARHFEELRVRNPSRTAAQIVMIMEGAMALALFHGDTNYIALAADAAVRIVAPESKRPVA